MKPILFILATILVLSIVISIATTSTYAAKSTIAVLNLTAIGDRPAPSINDTSIITSDNDTELGDLYLDEEQ